jgi:hypothetical protein
MVIDRALLIPGRQTPVLFQSINQSFDPLAEAVEGTIKGTGAMFILFPRDSNADTMAAQVLPNLPTAVGLVTDETPRPAFGASAPAPFHGPALHQRFEGAGFVPLARRENQRHQLAPAFRTEMDFGTEAALTTAERCGLRVPGVGPSRMLVRADDRAIDIVESPVEVLGGIGTLLDRGKEASPEACLAPAIKTASDGAPGAVPLWQVTPGGTGTQEPEDPVEDASVIDSRAASFGFLRRQERL